MKYFYFHECLFYVFKSTCLSFNFSRNWDQLFEKFSSYIIAFLVELKLIQNLI
jgi:hypothetical protein